MVNEVENPMLIDSLWSDEDEPEREDPWEIFCRKADEAYDGRSDEWQS